MTHSSDTSAVSDTHTHNAKSQPKNVDTPQKASPMTYQQGFATGAF